MESGAKRRSEGSGGEAEERKLGSGCFFFLTPPLEQASAV